MICQGIPIHILMSLLFVTEEQKEVDIGRAAVLAAREDGDAGLECLFGLNLDVGQFVSWECWPGQLDDPVVGEEHGAGGAMY